MFHVPPKQIEQREQKDPNNVDEVPVKPDYFDRTVILGIEASFQ
jgi:hypothetical protein